MGATTAIEWTDATFNPWIGCTKVSPGCDHCYAERREDLRLHRVHWGAGQLRQRTKTWGDPVRWNKQPFVECMHCRWRGERRAAAVIENPPGFHPPIGRAARCPMCEAFGLKEARRRVFCASLADVFDNEVDPAWRADLFDLIAATPMLDWLLLTKRIGNAAAMVDEAWRHDTGWPRNVWLGATVVNQAEADRDVPKLLATPARVRFLSVEPMLGAIRLDAIAWRCGEVDCRVDALRGTRTSTALHTTHEDKVDWIIAGGESGPHARPAHPDWARSLRDQCAAAGVPFLFKQWGEWGPARDADVIDRGEGIGGRLMPSGTIAITPNTVQRLGKHAAGRLLDGRTHDGMPG